MQRYQNKKNKSRLAFTLIELLVVIAIMGLLSTVVLVTLSKARGTSRNTKRVEDISQIVKGLELYYSLCDSYPLTNSAYMSLGFTLQSRPLIDKLGLNSTNGCGNNEGAYSATPNQGGFGNSTNVTGETIIKTIGRPPTPIDASPDANNGCNWSHSLWGESTWNEYVYLAADQNMKRYMGSNQPPANNKVPNYRLYFCIGEKIGDIEAGRYMYSPAGRQKCTESTCGIPID